MTSVQMGNNGWCCANWGSRSRADDPFSHGQIDHPGRAHQERSAQLTRRAGDQFPGRQGQGLPPGRSETADAMGSPPDD